MPSPRGCGRSVIRSSPSGSQIPWRAHGRRLHQQRPVPAPRPLPLELPRRDAPLRAPRGVVDDHLPARVVEAHRHDVVQPAAPRVDRHHERTALREMVTQDDHLARERDRHHPPLAREVGEARAADPPQLRLEQLTRDLRLVGRYVPVAHHHRKRRRAAGVLLLRHEGHLQLDRGRQEGHAQHAGGAYKQRAEGDLTASN